MGAALGQLEIDATGAEVKELITSSASILSTELIQARDPSTRAIHETPMSYIETLINTAAAKIVTYPAGEALAANDCVYIETSFRFVTNYVNFVPSTGINMGDLAANTRISSKFIGSGVSASTLKMGLNKVAAPGDNVTVRIETDTAGNPSGTLVNANATATISGASLST